MLVLSRKRDEELVIGHGTEQVRVRIVAIKGDAVRLGVVAPRHITVHRLEVYDKIQTQSATPGGESGTGHA